MRDAPLGYVLSRTEHGVVVYHFYAYGRMMPAAARGSAARTA
ncbi:hypothetical protein [Frondihabitans sp. VKM Ac-2883]|nr:hypothetical protein [Frondihabitans sp. VKM Ac-2883]